MWLAAFIARCLKIDIQGKFYRAQNRTGPVSSAPAEPAVTTTVESRHIGSKEFHKVKTLVPGRSTHDGCHSRKREFVSVFDQKLLGLRSRTQCNRFDKTADLSITIKIPL